MPDEKDDADGVCQKGEEQSGGDEDDPVGDSKAEKFAGDESGEQTPLERSNATASLAHVEWNAVDEESFARGDDGISHPAIGKYGGAGYRIGQAVNQRKLYR